MLLLARAAFPKRLEGNEIMKSPLRPLFVILALGACAWSQTYTYQIKLQGNPYGTGQPVSPLTIVGTKGYGSSYGAGGELYQASSATGVRDATGCCASDAPLVVDSSGNLYGQDRVESPNAPYGRIFAVKPGFKWFERDLYDFKGGSDGTVLYDDLRGQVPITESPIVFDSFGNILGMTYAGGAFPCVVGVEQVGCGVVFELTDNNGTWSEQVIHAFSGAPDGAQPEGGLTFDALTGNYYGTTQYGGDPVCNCGTVFELSPNGDGTWSENILYTFTSPGLPYGGVILDSQGNLYGTNFGDNNGHFGYIYEISGGEFSILYNFQGMPDGQNPNGHLVLDENGNLLGTTWQGGAFSGNREGLGTVFELSPSENGWQETIIHSFAYTGQRPTDGQYPKAGLAIDSTGNLWGGTPSGGDRLNGVFFEVTK
ncbi:MAG TPA: choice-of-anchor tandem repeat GloVer-containing protein [Terriglobales bacterium]|nr:choice-of-anchor tandem repeat GloVer-containing protein [Terriglobales bacterium]